MEKTINIHHEATIGGSGNLNSKRCKPVICIDTGEVFTSATDAAEKAGVHYSTISSACLGKMRTCKGKRYCYLSNATESLNAIVTRLRETASAEEDARKWREYQAEQEAIRKAEEKRLEDERKAKEEYDAAVAKLVEKIERRREICKNAQRRHEQAIQYAMDAEMEYKALTGELYNNGDDCTI